MRSLRIRATLAALIPDAGWAALGRASWPLLLAFSAVLFQCYYGSLELAEHPQADARFYLAMSEGGPSAAPAPFGYRALGPWLAGRLPMDLHAAYRLLTGLAILLCTAALFSVLASFQVPARAAGCAVLLWQLNKYLFGFESWNFYQLADWLGLLGLLACMLAFDRKRWLFLAGAFAAGLLARETPILLLPGFMLLGWMRKFGRREWLLLAAALLPGLLLAAWMRWHYRLPAEAGYLGLLRIYGVKWFSLATPARFFLNGWIPVACVPWIFFRESREFLRRRPDLLALGAGTLFSASLGGDNERLLLPALPAVYGLVAHILASRPGLAPGLLVCGAVSLPHHLVGPWTLPARSWTLAFSLTGALLAAAWSFRVRFTGARRPGPAR